MEYSKKDIERLVVSTQRNLLPDPSHRDALGERVRAEYDKSRSAAPQAAWTFRFQSFWRWVMARPVSRLGIPAVLVALVTLGVFTLFPAKTGFALDNIIEPLLSAKSGRCQVVVQMKDKKLPPFSFVAMFRGTAHRQENRDMGMVMIMEEADGTIVTLHPKEKQAHILQRINRDPKQSMEGGFLQQMREKLLGLKADKRITRRESLGERDIADKKLIGYRLSGPGGQFDIWGDQITGLPHSIISNMAAFPNMEVTMTGFEFDVELADSLFSLTPPAGYTVTRDTMDMSLRSEQGFIAALRRFAELNDGNYPDTINLMVGIKTAKKVEEQLADKGKAEREQAVTAVRKLLAAGFDFPLQLSANSAAAYAGKGVHREQAEKPIFWYKPEDAEKYRVVYADLSVVDAAQSPAVEGAQIFASDRAAPSAE